MIEKPGGFMSKQQLAVQALLIALTAGLGTAHAEGPAGPPPGKGKPADAGPPKPGLGKPEPGKSEPGPALGKAGPGRPEPGKAEPGRPDAQEKPGECPEADKDKPDRHAHGSGHGMRGLLGELKAGKIKKGDLKERLAKLSEKRDER